MKRILLVEDEAGLADIVKVSLKRESFEVEISSTCADAKLQVKIGGFDLIILDWNLPDGTGVELCRMLRAKQTNLPILMLTAMDEIQNKEEGFEAGADDYLTKPFSTRELIARVKALLRRPAVFTAKKTNIGPLSIDLSTRQVLNGQTTVHLKPLEFDLLEFFVMHPGQLISPDVLLHRVWKSESDASIDSVYSCVTRLRKKLGSDKFEFPLRTVHRMGYVFEPPKGEVPY